MADNFKHFVRVLNTDLVGNKPLKLALTKIKGIGPNFANAICNKLNLETNKQAGNLTEQEAKAIEDLIKSPKALPTWLYNRRKDIDTGEDTHITTAKLKLTKDFDIKRLKKIKSYRGMRHAIGLPSRGQRTRSHFRKGTAVGVVKKKAKGKTGK